MKAQEILKIKVLERFGIDISSTNLTFIDLGPSFAAKLGPQDYPTFTLFWQALASWRVCFHAVNIAPCDIFVDTLGIAYAYPIVKLFFGCKIYSYTHYPIVRTDMVETVRKGEVQFNNKDDGALRKYVKVIYYQILTFLYMYMGRICDEVASNSRWTRGHMDELWDKGRRSETM